MAPWNIDLPRRYPKHRYIWNQNEGWKCAVNRAHAVEKYTMQETRRRYDKNKHGQPRRKISFFWSDGNVTVDSNISWKFFLYEVTFDFMAAHCQSDFANFFEKLS